MPVSPALLKGFQLLRVGERSRKDKKYETDEFVAAPPGTIVAPRPKGMAPTVENAIQQLTNTAVEAMGSGQGSGRALYAKAYGPAGFIRPRRSERRLAGAQAGVYTVVSGDNLWSIWSRSNTGMSWSDFLALNSHLGPNYDLIHPGDTVYLSSQAAGGGAPAPSPPAAQPAPPSAPAATPPMGTPPLTESPGEMFAGQALIEEWLRGLSGEAEVLGIGIPQLQAGIMESLGFYAPSLYGLTDPAEFRTGLAGVLGGAPGAAQTYPTLAAKQAFAGTILRALGEPLPGLRRSGVPAIQAYT